MKKLHRATLAVVLAVLAPPIPAQRPERPTPTLFSMNPAPSGSNAFYAGGLALLVGGMGLAARTKRR